ncbi:hypothetical protein AYL99_12043 [Fonsecaea erecta]|uniref:Uncharacterized protein n=1 Tax=Fonsecaea erecta TaxID=1367422 RepID=A0A178Z1S9_9EURO|nr:hypothetical protein AYL99_12043 [Fonsecaea erecta]OAP53759.1 hypothetical protein AYL99_12043 [Fonsecaea erecta]
MAVESPTAESAAIFLCCLEIFNFYKVYAILNEVFLAREVDETSQ